MHYLELLKECSKRTLIIDIVLENDEIIQALKNKEDKKVIELLDNSY